MTSNQQISYRHVDVFASAPYRGNGLIVVWCDQLDRPAEQLRTVTAEMRQFETIFVTADPGGTEVSARIFTVEEELPFAGHPVIGAAAALHERFPVADTTEWCFRIAGRRVRVISKRDASYFTATMDQGLPHLHAPLPDPLREQVSAMLNLRPEDLAHLPLQVISTGLPYLIVPVTRTGLARARIVTSTFEATLDAVGAKFVYVLDADGREGRTWDNLGTVEDVATGSAAGPAAAYLHEHGIAPLDTPLQLRQGTFVARPSTITVTRDADGKLWVGGPVRPVAAGTLDAMPT